MNLVEAAERFAATDRSQVTLDPTRCLLSRDTFADCRRCADVCPVSAIHWARPPELDREVCVNCLGCLEVCPSGAFQARDAFPSLLRCVSHLDVRSIDIVCGTNPSPSVGPDGSQAGIKIRGCLAGLGRAAYLALAALGVEEVTLRLEACNACPVGALEGDIHRQINEAEMFLSADDPDHRLRLSGVSQLDGHERPAWDADNPPISRRDFFRLASAQSQLAAARAMFDLEPDQDRGPSLRRRRELSALARLDERRGTPAEGMLVGLGYAMIGVAASCSACGACARACPTAALTFESTDEQYRLLLDPTACNACEVCSHVCAEEAISFLREPEYREVIGRVEPVVLSEGRMIRCSICNTWMAATEDRTVCSLCAYRLEHPFGSRLPPHLASKLKSSVPGTYLSAGSSSEAEAKATPAAEVP
jgi:ferredoxin